MPRSGDDLRIEGQVLIDEHKAHRVVVQVASDLRASFVYVRLAIRVAEGCIETGTLMLDTRVSPDYSTIQM